MTGRSGLTDGERGDDRGYGRLLLVAVLVLAIAATAVLVLSNDLRFLRLGVLAALWAALVGAFLAVKYRREAASREDEVSDLQTVYELELEREVAARREYELEIEADTRRRVEEESKEDLDSLRGELRALRENLEALLGGEVLVERVALRAESTRMRSLSDQSRLLAVGEDRIIGKQDDRKGITVGVRKEAEDLLAAASVRAADQLTAPTELIDRIPHESPVRKEVRAEAPRRPEPSRPDPARQPMRSAQSAEAGSRAPSQARREPTRPQPQRQPQPATQVSRPAVTLGPDKRVPEPPRKPEARQPEQRPAERRPEPPRKPEPRQTAVPGVVGMRVRPPEPRQPEIRQPEARKPEPRPKVSAPTDPATMAMRLNPQARPPEQDSGRRRRPEPEPARPPQTEFVGRRTAPEPARPVVEEPRRQDDGGGRRRRPDAAASVPATDGPVWDPELGDWVPDSLELPIPTINVNGAAVMPQAASVPATPPPPVDAGAHAAGKSVSELLAAYGQEEPTRRRRRRAED